MRKAGFGKDFIRYVLTDVASLLAYHSHLVELLPLPVIVTLEQAHIIRKIHKKIRRDWK